MCDDECEDLCCYSIAEAGDWRMRVDVRRSRFHSHTGSQLGAGGGDRSLQAIICAGESSFSLPPLVVLSQSRENDGAFGIDLDLEVSDIFEVERSVPAAQKMDSLVR